MDTVRELIRFCHSFSLSSIKQWFVQREFHVFADRLLLIERGLGDLEETLNGEKVNLPFVKKL